MKAFIKGIIVFQDMREKEVGLSAEPSSAINLEDRSESIGYTVIRLNRYSSQIRCLSTMLVLSPYPSLTPFFVVLYPEPMVQFLHSQTDTRQKDGGTLGVMGRYFRVEVS